jgi:hypothetical protein
MNYIKQSSKDDPFEGLSLGDQKKMVVYFHHHANPKMKAERRRVGRCTKLALCASESL